MKKISVEKGIYPSIRLKQDENVSLNINYSDNLDLYFILEGADIQDSFEITKGDYLLYEKFLKLFNNIKEGRIFEESFDEYVNSYEICPKSYEGYLEKNKRNRERLKNTNIYKLLVNGNTITWFSDDFPINIAPFFQIVKEEDRFIVKFDRGVEDEQDLLTSKYYISVRIRNSGSFYHPFNINFMELFNDIKELDLDNEQIHMEEYEYMSRVLKK